MDTANTLILIVDDSLTVRMDLQEQLEEAGFRVIAAKDGAAARVVLGTGKVTLAILDLHLPDTNGFTLLREIRSSAQADMPVILLSADDNARLGVAGREGPRPGEIRADHYAGKPYDAEEVVGRVGELITRSLSKGAPRILAVDDSETYLQAIKEALLEEGYVVYLRRSGEAALRLLELEAVDCVLLDLVMPGMDGQEACRRIRANPALRDVPIMMLTAQESRETTLATFSAGADDYITKSGDMEILKARARAQIRRRQFEQENLKIRQLLERTRLEAAEEKAGRELAEIRGSLVEELQQKNRELEAFSYSVSHDLRTPLRAIDGFSQALLDDQGPMLDEEGRNNLARVRAAAQRMGELIADLLDLSRVGRVTLSRNRVDLSALALRVFQDLRAREPGRTVDLRVTPGLVLEGDERLVRIALENLLENAWKYTSKVEVAVIEVGRRDGGAWYVRDNGIGFEMAHAQRLFLPFQRLHNVEDFPGTGIGLATVRRIIERHGGHVWADSAPGKGACFYWNLQDRGDNR